MDFIHNEVLEGNKKKNCIKLEYISPSGEPGSERFAAIRGGIAWATDKSPFFTVILGQPVFDQYAAIKEPSFTLLLERADESFDLDARYSQLADDASLFCCDFYTDFSDKFEADRESYFEYRSKFSQPFGELIPAPFQGRYRTGVELIKTLVGRDKLHLPKTSECYSQLSRMSKADLSGKKTSERFWAIEALRHVVASFKRDPVIISESNYRSRPEGLNPWMAY